MGSVDIFTSVINSYLPEPNASLVNGIIFGVPLKTSKEFYNSLKVVGLLHIVVLSGMNINLIAAVIAKLTSFLSKQASTLITILFIIFFINFVTPQAPIVRAGIMSILTLVAIIYGKQALALYSLLISCIFILFFFPEWISTKSFQLSVGASLGLILFSPKKINTSEQNKREKIKSYFSLEFKTSLAAQIFTAPLIFIYFKQISLISPFSNILVSWTIAPIMIFGSLAALLGKINYYLGILPAYAAYGLSDYVIWVVGAMSKIPFASLNF